MVTDGKKVLRYIGCAGFQCRLDAGETWMTWVSRLEDFQKAKWLPFVEDK